MGPHQGDRDDPGGAGLPAALRERVSAGEAAVDPSAACDVAELVHLRQRPRRYDKCTIMRIDIAVDRFRSRVDLDSASARGRCIGNPRDHTADRLGIRCNNQISLVTMNANSDRERGIMELEGVTLHGSQCDAKRVEDYHLRQEKSLPQRLACDRYDVWLSRL